MTLLSISAFNGEVPRLPPDRLPDGGAQLAINCDFAHGELRSLKGLGTPFAAAVSPVRALFTDDGLRFFAWDKPTRAYLHPTIDDAAGRVIYQTHGLGVRVALAADMKLSSLAPGAPTQSWAAGVDAPTAAPTLTLTGVATDPNTVETVAYVAVAVNIWGEESAPSPVATIDVPKGQGVNIALTHAPAADQVALQGIAIYRTYASNQSADFYLLQDAPFAPAAGNDYAIGDATTTVQTTTVLASAEWDPPPAAAGNLTYVGNGFFVASSGKDLIASEPYRPHAWPYRMSFPNGIVGVIAVEGGALVTTQAQTYLVSGAHPTQLSQQLLPQEQAGLSDTSLTRVEGSAVYATNDGLVNVFGGQPSLDASQQLFTRQDWRGLYGADRLNLRLAAHDGRVLGLVDPDYPIASGGATPFLIDLEGGSYCRLDAGTPLYGAAVAATVDALYVGTDTGAAEFAAGADLPLTWQSGDVRYARPVAFAAARIECEGSFTVELRADGVLVHSEAVTGTTSFRLPPTGRAERWSVKLIGTGIVRRVDLGASFAELQQV